MIFNLAIVTPLVVAFWSSSWTFCSLQILPNDLHLSAWISFMIWIVFSVVSRMAFPLFNARCNEPVARAVLWRALLYPVALAVVNYWRGIWTLWDHYTGIQLQSRVISLSIGSAILLALRQTATIVAPPFTVERDSSHPQFAMYPRWENERYRRNFLFKMLDHFVAFIVTGLGVVSFWRGAWGVQDHLFFPDPSDFVRSAYTSLACGYPLFVLGYCSQGFYKSAAEKRSDVPRYLLEVLWMFLMGVASNMCWRGIWHLFDSFVYPGMILVFAVRIPPAEYPRYLIPLH